MISIKDIPVFLMLVYLSFSVIYFPQIKLMRNPLPAIRNIASFTHKKILLVFTVKKSETNLVLVLIGNHTKLSLASGNFINHVRIGILEIIVCIRILLFWYTQTKRISIVEK